VFLLAIASLYRRPYKQRCSWPSFPFSKFYLGVQPLFFYVAVPPPFRPSTVESRCPIIVYYLGLLGRVRHCTRLRRLYDVQYVPSVSIQVVLKAAAIYRTILGPSDRIDQSRYMVP